MLVTKEQLIDLEACREGHNRLINHTGNTNIAVEVTSLVGGENTVSDLLRLAGGTLPKEKIVKFACDCALLDIDLIKPYTDKFEIICGFLKAPKQGEVRAARAAAAAHEAAAAADAAAAHEAAAAADAAADAAWAAAAAAAAHKAAAAADAAAWAAAASAAATADAHKAAASASAASAAWATAYDADAAEINKLLIELLS